MRTSTRSAVTAGRGLLLLLSGGLGLAGAGNGCVTEKVVSSGDGDLPAFTTVVTSPSAPGDDSGFGTNNLGIPPALHRRRLRWGGSGDPHSPWTRAPGPARRTASSTWTRRCATPPAIASFARNRSDAPDARLDVCVGEVTKVGVLFAGSPPDAPVLVSHFQWSLPDRLPSFWGSEVRARMAHVLLSRHVHAHVEPRVGRVASIAREDAIAGGVAHLRVQVELAVRRAGPRRAGPRRRARRLC